LGAFSLLPGTFTDKWYEIAAAQVLYVVSFPELCNLEKFLLPSRADGDNQSPVQGQLGQKDLRDLRRARRNDNRIVRRFRWPAQNSAGYVDFHVGIAKLVQNEPG
jgi:hypothetical protein